MKYSLLILCSLFYFSCKTTKDVSKLTKEDVKIEMTRGACFGKCPIYTIKVYEGGYTTLDAGRFTKNMGKFSKTISKKEYKSLVAAFEAANLYQYPEVFENAIADLPLITLIYKGNQGNKIVRGKDERPAVLKELQYKIEKLYNEDDWTLIEAPAVMEKEPKDFRTPPREIKDQIIIKPKQGERLPPFFKEMERYGVRLLTRISGDQNLWLITYSTSEIEADKMLKIIQDHPVIEMAEFNKEVTTRDN